MGSIIKNQILKHLSKFTKNLSPDKINISTLKGEGELTNLELNEVVLMDLLDLPTWMRLNKAFCNKVSIKVQWTKLKSQPICLYLDEVVLEIATCAEPRTPNTPGQQSSHRAEGRYGFIDKVIDAMYVHINSVAVNFMSDKFHASLQLSRVKVQSLTPIWGQPTDIRQTRIRSEQTDEIILFKEVDWQTTRIEANAREDEEGFPSTPLRLIANQSKIRIVLKKKISDCTLIASRIFFLLDDLLWVLTDTQLKAAIVYGNSLSAMIEKSAEQSKRLAAEKLQKQGQQSAASSSGADQLLLQHQHSQLRPRSQTNEARMFQKFDVLTTSYHLITSRIDLHLCDDTPPEKESSPKHNKKINGGSMQITFHRLSVDFYPFHYAGGERKNWYRYSDNQGSRNSWVQGLFTDFRNEAKKARQTCNIFSPSQSPAHTGKSPAKTGPNPPPHQGQSKQQKPKVTKLLESCMVLKIEEFIIYMVSTADNKRTAPQKFFSSDKKALHLPADMSMVHIEYTDYFFTEGIDYPVPHANIYVLVNPVRLHLDYLTMLWANYFSLNLAQMVESEQSEIEKKLEHVDVKLEALMPRIVISAEEKAENQPDRPNSLQIQISKLTASNTHSENHFTVSDLQTLLDQYENCDMFEQDYNDFPCDAKKLSSIPKLFHDFAKSRVNPYLCGYALDLVNGRLPCGFSDKDFGKDAIEVLLRTNTLKRDMRCDMWGVCVDQVWLEFLGVPTSRTRPVPFVESFPLTLWICQSTKVPEGVVLPSNSSSMSGLSKNPDYARESRESSEDRENRRNRRLLKNYYSEDSTGEGSSPTDASSETGMSSSLSSSSCDNPEDKVQYTSLQIADFNIVAKIGAKIRAQLSNPQYLFLMRLIESISNFNIQLNADVDEYLKGDNKSPGLTFSVPLVLPEVEFAMVCPYIAELLPLSKTVELLNSPTPEDSDSKEVYVQEGEYDETQGYVRESNGYMPEQQESQVVIVTNTDTGHSDVSLIEGDRGLYMTYTNTDPAVPSIGSVSSGSTLEEGHIPHSQSDSTIICHTDPQHNSHNTYLLGHSTEDVSQSPDGGVLHVIGASSVQHTASDSGLSSLGSSVQGHQRSRSGSKLTPNSVKKSFTTGVSNFSHFVGKIKNKLDPDDMDDSDSISIRTDTSDDDDFEFLTLDDSEAPAFNHHRQSDTASSTDTDDMSSVFAESTSASRAKEFMSAVVFRLSRSEVLIQGAGEDMIFSLHTQAIDSEETGNVTYEDFYMRLSSQTGVIKTPASVPLRRRYPIKFKMTMGPAAEKLAPKGGELGVMEVQVADYGLSFRMSSILNMASFIEDEKISIPTPMHVSVDKFTLTLVEDRPPARPLDPPVTPPPLELNIHHMFIYRHDDGVFHMSTELPSLDELKISRLDIGHSPLTNGTEFSELLVKPTQNNLDLKSMAPDTRGQVVKMQSENAQLRLLLEKLDDHVSKQEEELEGLRDIQSKYEASQSENEELRNKLKSFAVCSGQSLDAIDDLRKENSNLDKENSELCERVVLLEDDIKNMRLEKESLVTTLQLMQDELMASEQVRQRKNTE